MQLKKLYIKDYKILKDFHIDFPKDSERCISIFIGINGSGKSTILEVIAQILSDATLRKVAKFGFELSYSTPIRQLALAIGVGDLHIKLFAKKGDTIKINISTANGEIYEGNIPTKDRLDAILGENELTKQSVFPDNVIIYYSGLSEIMKEVCEPHSKILSEHNREGNIDVDNNFFYFQPEHFNIILIALLSFEYGEIPDVLLKKGKIKNVKNITIRLHKPEWAKDNIRDFWGYEGNARDFLDYLNENTIMETWQNEVVIITIASQQKLFQIREHLLQERKLFEYLNTMFIDGLLKDISFNLIGENEEIFNQFSEGEQQAITIKGLTTLLSQRSSLFLFDEPDTYLHPKWQREFIASIENIVSDDFSFTESSFVIATHSPQLLGNAKPELNFVKIIEDGALIENTPHYYGRTVGTILYELMGVEERNLDIKKQISDLYTLIEEEEIENAEHSLNELQNTIGEDDTELKRAEIQISYLKEDE